MATDYALLLTNQRRAALALNGAYTEKVDNKPLPKLTGHAAHESRVFWVQEATSLYRDVQSKTGDVAKRLVADVARFELSFGDVPKGDDTLSFTDARKFWFEQGRLAASLASVTDQKHYPKSSRLPTEAQQAGQSVKEAAEEALETGSKWGVGILLLVLGVFALTRRSN